MRVRTLCLGLMLVAMAGCNKKSPPVGPGGGGDLDMGGLDPLAGLTAIAISPTTATLMLDGTTPATQQLTVTGTFANNKTQDITDAVTFSVAPSTLGSVGATGLFSSVLTQGGTAVVTAASGSLTASATLTILVNATENDPNSMNLPSNPGSMFGGTASTSNAPSLVYPNDNVVLPPNLGSIEFHFNKGASTQTLFELSFTNSSSTVNVFMRCNTLAGGCLYTPSSLVWSWLAETNRGGDAVAVSLRATDDNNGPVSTSNTIHMSFSNDDVTGGIYYWAINNNTASIQRYDFASTATSSTAYFAPSQVNGNCVGCHALSHDGTKMAVELGGQWDGIALVVDIAGGGSFKQIQGASNFEAWAPDNSKFLGVWSDSNTASNVQVTSSQTLSATDLGHHELMVFDGVSAHFVQTIANTGTASQPADHPDWSPDGTKIAYDRPSGFSPGSPGHSSGQTLQISNAADIEMVTTADNGATFSAPTVIVPNSGTRNSYYPAFAPDSSFLVFDQAPSGSFDANPNSKLMAILPQASATAIALTNANLPGIADGSNTQLVNSYPKWNPFVGKRTNSASAPGRVMWMTFASERYYGLRQPQPNSGSTQMWLWMVAIDPDKVAAGQDPSATAFFLPFQDLSSSNHIAQWATQIVGTSPVQ